MTNNDGVMLLLHNAHGRGRGHSDALKARRGGGKRTQAQKKQKDSKTGAERVQGSNSKGSD